MPGASATLQWGPVGYPLAARDPGIWIAGQPIAVRSHTHLPLRVFICPRCNRDCYRLYELGGAWACRKCHALDYACRHRHRSIPSYHRILYLRRRIGAEQRLFAPLPQHPPSHTRKCALVAEIRSLEARLVGHLGGINHDLGRRIRSRKAEFR